MSYLFQAYKFIQSAFLNPVTYQLQDTILISRSPEWKYGKGFYAAIITLKKDGEVFNVHCNVHVGNENYFESFALGKVSSKEEAYSRWGTVRWTADSLIIGSDEQSQITIKRNKIEKHR